jgi:hypothetical protein
VALAMVTRTESERLCRLECNNFAVKLPLPALTPREWLHRRTGPPHET